MSRPDLPAPAEALAGWLADDPYDPEVAADLAVRLFRALPAMYQLPDLPPQGRHDLLRMLTVLGLPLATVRQSVQELHADLFVDSADDAMVPYLAQMVGTVLAFPDAASNRRDVRGTVGWRRRKGTPVALEEMGGELTGQPVVLQEGWKRVQLAQDLDLLRPERTAVDVRPAVVAEQAEGPLDALAHAVDVRAVGRRTGLAHPRHVAHYLFPTVAFPLADAEPFDRSGPGTDLRFAFDPLGARRPLRARRPVGDRRPFTDRIPEQHFAADPARWFGAEGGFTVRLHGLAAAVPGHPVGVGRAASDGPAARTLAQTGVAVELLDRPTRGWRGPVRVSVGLAAVSASGGTWQPTLASYAERGWAELDAAGVTASGTAGGAAPGGTRVVVLRLSTPDGAGRHFPGATLAVTAGGAAAGTAAPDSDLAREGFLAGAVHVIVPPVLVDGEWAALVALDGSLYAATADQPLVAGERRLAPAALVAAGPGAAFPAALPASEPVLVDRAPAPGRGPVVLHGLRVVRRTPGGYAALGGAPACALTFGLQLDRPGLPDFAPIQRLAWTGADPASATWSTLGDAVPVLAVEGDGACLAVRFETAAADAVACPGEVAWTSDDGRAVLVHLPQLEAGPLDPAVHWPVDPTLPLVSDPVRVGADGSTWASDSTALARASLGAVEPLAAPLDLRRRRVGQRVLCGWDNEDPTASPPLVLGPTDADRLDVDVAHGLFSLSAVDPPRPWPAGGPPPPAVVTVAIEEGATTHLGALPAAREPVLDRRLARPTRLVCGAGTLHRDAPLAWHDIPRYPTLTAALAAVDATWTALTGDQSGVVHHEVVQFEDDATYAGETPTWPTGAAGTGALLRLTIQVAERRRPVVLVDPVAGWGPPAAAVAYDAVELIGVALGGEGWSGLTLPPTREVSLDLVTVLHAENTLTFEVPDQEGSVVVHRSQTAGLRLLGPGALEVADSIVDAGSGVAVEVPASRVWLARTTVAGPVTVRELAADGVVFADDVTVQDRFHGCVRYSRVTSTSVLPQVHRVVVDVVPRVVSRNRRDPGWWRLREDCDPAISAGAEDGSELGAFGAVQLTARMRGFRRRLQEYTPAGLQTGVIRMD